MRTPSLRRRVTLSGVVVVAVLLLAVDVVVYVTMRRQLLATLDDVLASRAELVVALSQDLDDDDLVARLASLGIPALIRTPDGRTLSAEPATPRFGIGPPGPVGTIGSVPRPRVSREVPLVGGATGVVFATRVGVDTTLRRLLVIEAAATTAALLAAVVLLRRATSAAMAPLEHVVAAARRTAAGATGERLRPEEPDTELGRMARAHDEMLDALEAALDDARASDERSQRFLQDAAHQLRTPIAGVRASAEALLRERGPGERDRLMANLLRETARAGRIQAALLHMARLDRGQPPVATPTDLVALCEDEVERARSLAPHLAIELHADRRPPDLVVDAPELKEAIGNLLDNARRHARGNVTVSVRTVDDRVEISVADDGPGLPEGTEELVFERFATLDGRGGSGLGLPIARAVARAHGGDLRYDDRAFVVSLPLTLADR